MECRRFVVLDRDGTLIKKYAYLSDPDKVELIPGTADALRLFKKGGFGVVVVSNQSGVGRGFFNEVVLEEINTRLHFLLLKENTGFDKMYSCLHDPGRQCACRKPSPGLLIQASKEFKFDPKETVVIGDNICDIDLGKAVGAKTILVRTGDGEHVEREGLARPDYVVDDLLAAAELIVGKKSYVKGSF